ncbi:unnamed protein product [Orchesella dallaii]|uniref:Uncharacterized protein n=1 Tax=Orchesella dallaii TaxID=48710 RepID=A0ABP1RLI5_9HEXA
MKFLLHLSYPRRYPVSMYTTQMSCRSTYTCKYNSKRRYCEEYFYTRISALGQHKRREGNILYLIQVAFQQQRFQRETQYLTYKLQQQMPVAQRLSFQKIILQAHSTSTNEGKTLELSLPNTR